MILLINVGRLTLIVEETNPCEWAPVGVLFCSAGSVLRLVADCDVTGTLSLTQELLGQPWGVWVLIECHSEDTGPKDPRATRL